MGKKLKAKNNKDGRRRRTKKDCNSSANSSSKNDSVSNNHGDQKKATNFQEAFKESMMFQMVLHTYESQMRNLLDELDNANKANSLHLLKKMTNDVRNPCDIEHESFRVLYQ